MRRRIAAVGECMVELASNAGGAIRGTGFAGDTCNTAVYLRRLLAPDEFAVSYATSIGSDQLSTQMLQFWQTEGLDTNLVHRHAARTVGIYLIENDAAGERRFIYWRDRTAARTLFDDDPSLLEEHLYACEMLIVSAILPAVISPAGRTRFIGLLGEYRARGGRIAFDSNYRPQLWESPAAARACITQLHELAHIALPSLDDELALFGDVDEAAAIARLQRYGADELILKRGARGPLLWVRGAFEGARHAEQPHADAMARDNAGSVTAGDTSVVTVVDATGAGDAFNAGYLAGRVLGESPVAALQVGHALAARVVMHQGALLPRTDVRRMRRRSV